jgi:hypothetical protein
MPKIFIATPTTGGVVKAHYVTTMAGAVIALMEQGIGVETFTLDAGDLPKQRDAQAHIFLHNTDCTHMLFIDSDMLAPPHLALRLLRFDKPLIGTIYAKRQSELQFNVGLPKGGMSIADGLCEVEWFGLGFAMIRRDCFETMRDSCRLLNYANPFLSAPHNHSLGFFQPTDILTSEDISFCRRWRNECREPLWAYTDADIKHVGDYLYGVPFTDYVRANNKVPT